MFDGYDLSHITKQIQKETAEVKALRQQAQHQRDIASQKYQEENAHSGDHYEKEADHLELRADEFEANIEQLQASKQRLEARIAELEARRTTIDNENTDRLAQLDNDIAKLRGNGMML